MTLVSADRIRETATTAGTGTFNLLGAVANYRSFVTGIGDTNTCYYCIVHRTVAEWEVGLGTVTDGSPDTLSRDTVLSSSTGSKVSFSAGTKDVIVTSPANALQVITSNDKGFIVTHDAFTDIGFDTSELYIDSLLIGLLGAVGSQVYLSHGVADNRVVNLSDTGIEISTKTTGTITIQASTSSNPSTILLSDDLGGGLGGGIHFNLTDGGGKEIYFTNRPSESVEYFQNEGQITIYGGDTKQLNFIQGDGALEKRLDLTDAGISMRALASGSSVYMSAGGSNENMVKVIDTGIIITSSVAGIDITTTGAGGNEVRIIADVSGDIDIFCGLSDLLVADTEVVVQNTKATGGRVQFVQGPANNNIVTLDDTGITIGAGVGKIGFYAATPVVKQTVTGARNLPESAFKDLLTKLALYGFITDSTTAI